jgi:hypothetical protein
MDFRRPVFRKKLDEISRTGYQSKSEIDLSAVPGSCSNIKNLFENNNNDEGDRRLVANFDREELQVIISLIWDHIRNTSFPS